MTNATFFAKLRDLIQVDIGHRGLASLFAALPNELENACRSLASEPNPRVLIITGFFIPTAGKPETDGPFGACLLADALQGFCTLAVEDWLAAALSEDACSKRVVRLPLGTAAPLPTIAGSPPTHIVAIERPGPAWSDGQLYTMRGADVTERHASVHVWFEATERGYKTIAIGDGGNEIGMGKLPRMLVEQNVPKASTIGCRTPADHLIVSGLSNWGAYALAAGTLRLRGDERTGEVFDEHRHLIRCREMMQRGGLVDGVTGSPSLAVDGQPWETYIRVFRAIRKLLAAG